MKIMAGSSHGPVDIHHPDSAVTNVFALDDQARTRTREDMTSVQGNNDNAD